MYVRSDRLLDSQTDMANHLVDEVNTLKRFSELQKTDDQDIEHQTKNNKR